MPPGFLVEVAFEFVPVHERERSLSGGTRFDLLDEALHVGIGRPVRQGLEDERQAPRPAPERHIGDRIAVAEYVRMFREPIVKHLIVPFDLAHIAIDRIGLARIEMSKMHALAGIGPMPSRRTSARTGDLHAIRQELAGLFREIEQDRIAVEDGLALVHDDWHLRIRIERQKGRIELLAAAVYPRA